EDAVAVLAAIDEIGQRTDREEVVRLEERDPIFAVQAFAGEHPLGDRDQARIRGPDCELLRYGHGHGVVPRSRAVVQKCVDSEEYEARRGRASDSAGHVERPPDGLFPGPAPDGEADVVAAEA